MKKVAAVFLSLMLLLSLTACGQSETEQQGITQADVQAENSESEIPDINVEDSPVQTTEVNVADDFIPITGGTFQMGSPDTES